MPRYNRRNVLKRLGAVSGTALVGSLAGCTGDDGDGGGGDDGSSDDSSGDDGSGDDGSGDDGDETETIRVAAISVGNESDYWNVGHRNSIDRYEEENVEWNWRSQVAGADAADIMRGFAEDGVDIVYASSFDFQDQALTVSEEYPDVAFEHVAGMEVGDNMGQNYTRFYEGCYLAGYATAMTLEDNGVSEPLLGYVASFPIAPTLRRINSFANGAWKANSDTEMQVNFIGSWYDPPGERQAATALIDEGAHVLYNGTNSGSIVSAASDSDVWSVGMYASMAGEAEDRYITSVIPRWDEMYANSVEQVRNGEWSADVEWRGHKFDWMGLDDWGPNVPQSAKDAVDERRQQIIDGELDPFHGTKYEGHHNDQEEPGMTEGDQFLLTQVSEFIEPIRGQA